MSRSRCRATSRPTFWALPSGVRRGRVWEPSQGSHLIGRARRRVVEQADAAPPARLEGQHAACWGDLEEEVDQALATVPGEEAAHHHLGDAADAPLIAWT